MNHIQFIFLKYFPKNEFAEIVKWDDLIYKSDGSCLRDEVVFKRFGKIVISVNDSLNFLLIIIESHFKKYVLVLIKRLYHLQLHHQILKMISRCLDELNLFTGACHYLFLFWFICYGVQSLLKRCTFLRICMEVIMDFDLYAL